ncbi:MAG: hypothetical protein NZ933_09105, partial [Bacteroidia bacterium]|nr:hypothetical protein [Bacteroidia bacterium]
GTFPFCFVIDGKVYVGGRWPNCASPTPTNAVYRYDPSTDTWTSVASLPQALWGGAGASDGRYGYVLGGLNVSGSYLNTLYRYDPVSNSWTTLASYPLNVWSPALAYLNGSLYASQGGNNSGLTPASYRYDIASNSWTAIANAPVGGYEGWGVSMNGMFYNFGFHTTGGYACTNQFYLYNPASNSWSSIAIFPGGVRNDLRGAVIGGRYFGGFGHDCAPTFHRDWWMYCP